MSEPGTLELVGTVSGRFGGSEAVVDSEGRVVENEGEEVKEGDDDDDDDWQEVVVVVEAVAAVAD